MTGTLRVGLVCPYSLDAHGGVQNHVLDLAASLRRHGHHAEVLAPGERTAWASLPSYVTTTGRAVPVPYNGSVARVSFGPLVAARVRRWLEAGRFDVLHIHEPATPSVSVLALWAAQVPVVATFHTAQERSRALETSAATFLRAGLEKVSAHLAVSPEAASTLGRYQDVVPQVLPNGIEVARFRGSPRVEGEGPVLAFVGRVDEPRKGLGVLLAALPAVLAAHPTVRLRVVGGGGSPQLVRRALVRGLGVAGADRVELLGPVDDPTKARVLAGADVFVAPHTGGESFGIVLVEAMAAGAAVVASDLPAFRHVLANGRYGALFRVGDPAALAAAVTGLLADPGRRARLGALGPHAASAYDWAELTPRVLQVYRGVVRERREVVPGAPTLTVGARATG